MIIVVPFHDGDRELCLQNLETAKALGPVPFPAVVAHPDDCESESIILKAKEVFPSVGEITVGMSIRAVYPWCKNMLFQGVAREIQARKEPWLWWEPDAVPLKRGWAEAIEQEYQKAGKPFMGFRFQTKHLDSVAVYPWMVPDYSTIAMLARSVPWEQAAGNEILPHAHASDLFHVVWDIDGMPPSFPGPEIPKEAVLLHRCKDGSLHEIISGKKRDASYRGQGKGRTCIVMLGRYGDIINALPVAKHIYEKTGSKPGWMVASQFRDILDGVSYVDPLVWESSFVDLVPAIEQAKKTYDNLLVAQVNGRNFGVNTVTESFAKESWKQMGYLKFWDRLPLVFDRRDTAREERLVSNLGLTKEKTVLVNLSGKSSPYDHSKELLRSIILAFGEKANIVDLSTVKAERVYDLLGLFDQAHCLVTIDTSTTHLALGSKIPVVNLVVDRPTMWHGAPPKGNSVYSARYSEAKIPDIISAIGKALEIKRTKFFHLHTDYFSNNPATRKREILAFRSWEIQYSKGDWTRLPVKDSDLPRLFDEGRKKLPFVRDLINQGASQVGDNDVIVFSNTDTCFTKRLTDRLEVAMERYDAIYGHRRDFKLLNELLTDEEVLQGEHYPGVDIFVFRKSWWMKHREKFPSELVLSREFWDWCLSVLIKRNGGAVIPNAVYHQRHESEWEVHGKRLSGNVVSEQAAKPFLRAHGEKV